MKYPLIVIGRDKTAVIGLHNLNTASSLHIALTMTGKAGLPIFLENRPSVMYEQVLWLIKNSGLNLQVRETPFSLDINLKKCYAKLWNQNNGNPVSSQPAHHLFSSQIHPAQETQDNLKDNSELLDQINLLKLNLRKLCMKKTMLLKICLDLTKHIANLPRKTKNF